MTEKATAKDTDPNRRLMPPVYFLVTILLIAALHFSLPIATIIAAPWSYSGAVVIGAGFLLVIVAARQFQTHATAIRPFEESSALVTDGVYRFSRNPMYLGLIAILAGVAILLGTLNSFLPIPFFAFLIQQRFILREEAMLAGNFGDRYCDYRREVRRWI